MSFQKENYEIYTICLTFLGGTFVALFIDWAIFNDLLSVSNHNVAKVFSIFYAKVHPRIMALRALYVFCALAIFFIKPPLKLDAERNKSGRLTVALFTIAFFLFGYSPIALYNLYCYPVFIFGIIYASYLIFSLLGKTFKNENIFGISNEPVQKALKYTFNTDQGVLGVHSGEQHVYVQGGSGAGKSDSILKPGLYQHAFMDFPALIYDFKGNPPTLGKTAYTAFVHAKLEKKEIKTKLMFLNFADVTRSNRCNPFSSRYLKDNADIQQTVSTLLKNYSKEFREGKGDLWYKGAKAVWVALIIRFQNDKDLRDKLCLPIINELLLCDDKEALIAFIVEDEEAKKQLASVQDSKASQKQFVGYITSANDFCPMLVNENLYWLMSEDAINLNINTKEDPTFFCIATDERKKEVYNPIAAMIIDVASRYFLEQNKLPTLFQLDEIYTIYLENLPEQANVFRSNGVCLMIGNQLRAQMVDKYGEQKAKIIMGACGNSFYGQSSDAESTEGIQKILSDVDMHTVSISTSESGLSTSDGMKRQKAREVRDIASQPSGMFTGKIANGKPAFFSAQFERYPYHDQELEIPPFVLETLTIEELTHEIGKNYKNICNLARQIIDKYRKTETLNS